MGDDISSGFDCFDFRATNVVQFQYVVYGRLTTIDDSLLLNPNLCHHPLIIKLSLKVEIKTKNGSPVKQLSLNELTLEELPSKKATFKTTNL